MEMEKVKKKKDGNGKWKKGENIQTKPNGIV